MPSHLDEIDFDMVSLSQSSSTAYKASEKSSAVVSVSSPLGKTVAAEPKPTPVATE
jgi:hypothetical protein